MMNAQCFSCDWLKALHLSWERSDLKIFVWTDHEMTESNSDVGVPEAIFPGHSLVLRSQSSVFDTMLSGGTFLEGKTGNVTLRGFSARAVEYFLRYLYTSSLPLVPEHRILELLMLSHQYDVQGLFWECSQRLCASVQVKNACQFYQTADHLQANDLRDACAGVIRENLNSILENDLFHCMNKDLIYQFLCVDSMIHNWNACRRLADYHSRTGDTWTEFPSRVDPAAEGSPYRDAPRLDSFVSDLYMDSSHSDVQLVVSDDIREAHFPAHSLVLVSQSTVFRKMWENSKSKKQGPVHIHVHGYSPRTVEYLLGYMYTQHVASEIGDSQLMSLVALASAYKVNSLVDVCEERLACVLTEVNACELLSLAARLRLNNLKQFCLRRYAPSFNFIVHNCLHFALGPKELTMLMGPFVRRMRPNDFKVKEMVEQWARWRLCLAPADYDDTCQLDSLVRSVMEKLV